MTLVFLSLMISMMVIAVIVGIGLYKANKRDLDRLQLLDSELQ